MYDDERLIRSREAMLLAVQIFNSGTLKFKTEVFAMLVNVAWTYLLHEFYERSGKEIIQADGRALLLSQMIKFPDAPLSQGIKNNLGSIKEIRDAVEHTLFRRSDTKWMQIFQACCLNYEKVICKLFGKKLTLQNELSFALQFAKLGFDQVVELNKHEIPASIEALDKHLSDNLSAEQQSDLEYRFRVTYTIENSTKSKAHMRFIHPDDEAASEIRNVMIKEKISDDLYPFKALNVCKEVVKLSGRNFTSHNHTQAWRKFDARPRVQAAQPQNTNKEWCIYHSAHKDYTYSQKWIDFLVELTANTERFDELTRYKL